MAMKIGIVATLGFVFAIQMATGNEEDASLIQTRKMDNSANLDENGTIQMQASIESTRVAGICVPSTPMETKWTGHYVQPGQGNVPMNFDLTFNPNGQISGGGKDVGGWSSPFKWSGTFSGNTMDAVKTYDDKVFIWNYKGQVTAQSGGSTTWSGKFYDMTGKHGGFSASFSLNEKTGALKVDDCSTPTPPPTPCPDLPIGDMTLDDIFEKGVGTDAWKNCVGSSDNAANSLWGAAVRPYKGNKMFGFHSGEEFHLRLPEAMTIGVPFKLGVATAIGAITPWSSDHPAMMNIHGGTSSCSKGELLGKTTVRPNQAAGWLYEDIVFTPTQAYTYLYFVAETPGQPHQWCPGKCGYLVIDFMNSMSLTDYEIIDNGGKPCAVVKETAAPTNAPTAAPPSTAAPTKAPNEDDDSYHQTDPGADSCPGAALTSSECKKAAGSSQINKPWDRVDSWSNGPSGCFTNGQKVYFNTHKSGPSNAKWSLICHVPTQAQCKGGCYNGKGVMNKKKCGETKCDGCCECTGECAPTPPPTQLKCDDSCYTKKGNLNPSKQCSKSKCNGCCECTGECQDWDPLDDDEKGNEINDEHLPEYECAKWCYSKKHKAKSWEKKCTWFACSTCPECPDDDDAQCKGSCYTAKGVLSASKQCGKEKCAGCCECTGECPPTEPPVKLMCDDSCYTKKGNLNPSKQCSKNKCNNCCECTGECQDWDPLDDDEKGNEINDEHLPEYECAKWCYSKKHSAKSWEKKCTWFACSTCPECPAPEEKCEKSCYYKKSGKVRKDRCETSDCEGCPECGDMPEECDDKCYNPKNGKMKLGRCDQRKCAACPECDEPPEPPSEPRCDDDACYNAKNGNFKKHKCGDMNCAACSECGSEDPQKEMKCDDSCFKKKDGSLKPNICLKTKCAGCSGCDEPQILDGSPQEPQIMDGTDQCTKEIKFCKTIGPQGHRATCCGSSKGKAVCQTHSTATVPKRDACEKGGKVWCNSAGKMWRKSSTKLSDFSEWGINAETKVVDC